MPAIKPIPEGFSTLTPSLTLENAAEAIELYRNAFGAQEEGIFTMEGSNKIMHACLTIGSSKIFINDPLPEMGPNCATPSQSAFYVYLEDVDTAFARAAQAGMQKKMAPQDMFWGDRTGTVKDKFGISWTLATHIREVSPEEMEEAKKTFGKAA